jgi:4-hydroxy-2-oxoheptanedioate aldolase
MRKNRIRERLAAGEIALGGNVGAYAPDLVELLGAMGLDWVFIDCEHGSMNETEVTNMVRAADIYNMTPILRVPTNSPSVILRFMDVGVMGVVIPHLDTKEDAEKAVSAVKYYPMGERGSNYGGGRNNDYGIGMTDVRDYYEASNRETMVIALIESEEAVNNIDEIVAVPGLDVGWLGPADMAQSMGFPGQSVVDAACDRVIEATIRAGKIGAIAHPPYTAIDTMSHYYDLGARMMSTGLLPFIKDGMAKWKEDIKGLAAGS